MKIEVIMPKMGESLQEGTITKWLKKAGDKIERDEMILEISTDKVDTEVPAPNSGVLSRIIAQEGETIEVGKVIAEIETDAGSAVSAPAADVQEQAPAQPEPAPARQSASAAPATAGNLVDVIMPKMGESLQEGTITKWLKKTGDAVERDEMILEISTDKVDTEVPSPVAGTLAEITANEGETIEVGKVIARISTGGSPVSAATVEDKAPVAKEQPAQSIAAPAANGFAADPGTTDIPRMLDGRFMSPLVRSIAKAEGISTTELQSLNGTGIDGRITKEDLTAYMQNRRAAKAATSIEKKPETLPAEVKEPAREVVKPQAAIPVSFGDDDEIIPMDRVRRLIAEHMIYSKHTSAHVTSVGEADVTQIVKFRDKYKAKFESSEGFKLTFTPFFAQAVVDGVKKFPMVNVSVDGTNIIRHRRINLSFATALDDGNLIVPVIKGADSLNLKGLAYSVYDLATRARTKKLNPDDIQGGTITLTNVGTFGTLFGTPVINQPQTAIIGVGAIQKRPVVREFNGEHVIVIRDMMYVSITYDHRVIDGMLAGKTLAAICKALEGMNESNLVL